MSVDGVAKLVWVVGAVAVTACVTVPSMNLWNRSNVKRAHAAGKREGTVREKARQDEAHRQGNAAYEDLNRQIDENGRMFKLALALVSVGFATAATVGGANEQDKAFIEEYILGVSKFSVPKYVRAKMDKAALNPPDVKTAFAHAAGIATGESWRIFDELVDLVISMKPLAVASQSKFQSEWHYLRAIA